MQEHTAEFIRDVVDSPAKLELVLFLHANPYALETARSLAQRLLRPAGQVEAALQDLTDAEVAQARAADGTAPLFTYNPDGPYQHAIQELGDAYAGPEHGEILAAVLARSAARQEVELAELRRLSDLKTRFISVVSHELRTPATVVKGSLATLRARPDLPPGERDEVLTAAQTHCDRLILLIEDLLAAAGADTGRGRRLQMEAVPPSDLLAEAIEEAQGAGATHAVVADVVEGLDAVWADRPKVAKMLGDLLDNAVKFSPEGGQIRVAARSADRDVLFSVEDEGIGLDPDEAERVFERFYQVDSSETRRAGGVGLGLFLARRTVEAHGGRIWIETGRPRGLQVLFTLPACSSRTAR